MYKIGRQHFALAGAIMGVLTIVLILIGVIGVLEDPLYSRNLMIYVSFGILVGMVTAALIFFGLRITGNFFLAGLLLGFFEMFRGFFNKSNGWGDLIGILSVFLWPAAALCLGLVIQAGHHLYALNRGRNK